jgi:hypothetical protein
LASCLKSPNTAGPKDLSQGQSAGLSVVILVIKRNNNQLPNGYLGCNENAFFHKATENFEILSLLCHNDIKTGDNIVT